MPEESQITTPLGISEPPRRRGRPPNASKQPLRQPLREAGEIKSRDGEVLTRKRSVNSDQFHIPDSMVPDGWSYQWNTVEVYGRPEIQTQIQMRENGWRPVPASRHPEMFMPGGQSGNEIIRDGLRLEERPIELTWEAQDEDDRRANRLVQDQIEQHGLAAKMPDGFSRDNPNLRRAERSQTRRSYAPEAGAPRPQLPIDPT